MQSFIDTTISVPSVPSESVASTVPVAACRRQALRRLRQSIKVYQQLCVTSIHGKGSFNKLRQCHHKAALPAGA